MRIMMLLALATLAIGAAPPQQEVPHCHMIGPFVVFFERGSAALDSESRRVLDQTKEIVTADICFRGTRLLISGHSDRGEREAIALKRAEAARDYLVKQGVSVNQIRIDSQGSRFPRQPPVAGMSDRESNQRAEILFGVP